MKLFMKLIMLVIRLKRKNECKATRGSFLSLLMLIGLVCSPDLTFAGIIMETKGSPDIQIRPIKQGNNFDDMMTTSRIKNEIAKNQQLAMDSKNLQILTYHGYVTLKGGVKTAEDKQQIEKITLRAVGISRMNDRIEVGQNRGLFR